MPHPPSSNPEGPEVVHLRASFTKEADTMTTRIHSTMLMAGLLAAASLAFGDESRAYGRWESATEAREAERIRPIPDPPPVPDCFEPIRVSVWSDDERYWIGQDVEIGFRVDRDAHVYILSTDARGVTRQIFPNPWDTDNRARAGRTYRLPDGPYRFVADGPPGWETLTAIATTDECGWIAPRVEGRSAQADPFPVVEGGPEAVQQRIEREGRSAYDKHAPSAKSAGPERVVIVPDPWVRPGYGVATTSLRVVGPRAYPDPYRPAPVFDLGTLRIRTTPPRAEAFIDGRFVGYTPLEIGLPEGRYELELHSRGYAPWGDSIRIDDDRTTTVRAELERGW